MRENEGKFIRQLEQKDQEIIELKRKVSELAEKRMTKVGATYKGFKWKGHLFKYLCKNKEVSPYSSSTHTHLPWVGEKVNKKGPNFGLHFHKNMIEKWKLSF